MKQAMSGYEGERWVDPHDYKRRSRSLENASAIEGALQTAELVNRGLSLAGRGLGREGGVDRLVGKNFSTSEIDSRRFDPRNPPEDGSVEEEFQVLLRDKKYFWGEARKNLPNFSREKKWSLICSFRCRENLNCSNETTTVSLARSELLSNLDQCLRVPLKLSKALHQLEKALRQSGFAQSFLAQDHIKTLFQSSSIVKGDDLYVYLRCFKTLMNYQGTRLEILNNSPLLNYFCGILAEETVRLSCKLVSTEILLLLTYVDEEHGYEKVFKCLNYHVRGWLRCMEQVLNCDVPTENEPFYARIKAGKNRNNYITTSLFLINSIVQALGSKEHKLLFVRNLKENKIHHCFHLMKRLQLDDIDKQIEIYLDLERKIWKPFSSAGEAQSTIYEPALRQLINSTKGTLIEQDLSCLIESFNKIVESRTTAESIKIFKSLGTILSYLVDNFCTDVSSQPATLVQESINKYLDKLQSDEIARRAMNEMTELENVVVSLRKQLSELKELKDTSKEKLVKELKSVKTISESKDTEILKLSKKLEETKELRRHDKRKLEHALSHQNLNDSGRKTHSIFDNLKTRSDLREAKSKRVRSLLKSQRFQSLSSIVKPSTRIGFEEPFCARVTSDENSVEMSDLSFAGSFDNSESLAAVGTISSNDIPASNEKPMKRALEEKQELVDTKCNSASNGKLGSRATDLSASSVSLLDGDSAISSSGVPLAPPPPPPPPPPPLPDALRMDTSSVENTSNGLSGQSNGGIPPPPPLPAPFLASKALKPKAKQSMRQIHWEKLDEIAETLWADQDQKNETIRELEQSGIFSQLENNFKVKESVVKVIEKSDTIEKTNSKTFLPRDLAQQFGINLHMFSQYSPEEFVLKVLKCDSEILQNSTALEFFTREDLVKIPSSLRRLFEPYSTDYLRESLPPRDPSELDRPDRIFLELCFNLRSYWFERSFCLLILTTYERDYYDLVYKLQKVDDVIQRLKHGFRFKSFLYIVVEIGNYMNKRPAGGIRISSLNKLAFVKSSKDQSVSFLHFIERLIRVKYPDLYAFTDELSKVEDLGKVSLDHLEQECNDFRSKIATVVGIMKEGKLSDPDILHPEDLVIKKMTYKVNRASTKSELLHDQLKLIGNDLDKLMRYFGEDCQNLESKNNFFQSLIEFTRAFKKCAKENAEREERERIYEQRRNMIETRQKSVSSSNSKSQDEDDAVDVLLAKLRGVEKPAGPIRRRRSTRFIDDSSQGKNSSQKSRPIPAGSNRLLLERTHAMLEDIQNI